jgi:hypothetical protein
LNTRTHPGSIKLAPNEDKQKKRRQHSQVQWETTVASRATNCSSFSHMKNQPLFRAEYFVAKSSDRCEVDSWVVTCSPLYVRTCRVTQWNVAHGQNQNLGKSVYGRVVEIFTPSTTSVEGAIAVLDQFYLKESRHPTFGMPVLSCDVGSRSHLVVYVKVS